MALFSYRTEEMKPETVAELFVETEADRKAINELIGQSPVILEGSRGTGKSFLLRMAEQEMSERFEQDRVLPVYLSFKKSSLVQSSGENRFLYWMMSKLCSQTIRAFKARNFLQPSEASLTLSSGRLGNDEDALHKISNQFEESWRDPTTSIEVGSVPDVDNFIEAVEELCQRNGVERICILFDEAAHVFRLEQQHAFFSLFRDLRNPYITCNAAVYPGITSYGGSFELAHDATLVRLDRNISTSTYVESMREIVLKQANRKAVNGSSDEKRLAERIIRQADASGPFASNFPLLAYCAHGNPRHLLKTIGTLKSYSVPDVEATIKTYYREEVWKEHTALGEKFRSYKSIVDWGRDFVEEELIPKLAKRNDNPETRGTKETTAFFWIHRDAPEEIKKALSLLSYVGLVQELDRGYRGTRKQLGIRFFVHLGALLANAAHPAQELGKVVPTLAVKRMIEFGKNHQSFGDVEFEFEVSDDMLSIGVVQAQLAEPVEVLDLSEWQISKLDSNGFNDVGDVLSAGEDELRRIYMVGEVRSRQMYNAAKAAMLEYLLG
ncbi:MAG: hypothetical protein COA34_014895 [Methylophaga sp.]|uniref:ORC-CDC6 family AAA ATPase n=1 Tax=Methylophaga sp. TaxID=2024840 RepID=UPI00216DCCE2|nr:hypothetical protein [Methylophaga sp.]MBL1459121.1 hypothetical protein [Methylophaga sp.]